MMKTHIGTGALALLIAAAPATAQTAPGQMTGPAQTTPGSTDMTTQPAMNPPGSTVQTPMDQNAVGQPAMDRSTDPAMDRSMMGTPTQAAPMDQANAATSGTPDGPTSPDGSPAFGIEPYFGILGGYDSYDRGIDGNGNRGRRLDGAQIEGVIGVNIPLGAVFVGVEGHGARGFGDIRWEYGVRGRGGFRMGDSGLIYASAGYTWTNVLNRRGFDDRKSWVWGFGIEAGPRDIGLGGVTSRSGPRFRLSVETADFNSIRPMAGVIFHF